MYKVIKRDGKEVSFNIKKISDAIRKAFDACDRQYEDSVIDMIALRVASDFEPKIKDNLISVEDIQDSAEKVLMEAGFPDVSKAYILYRKQRESIRNITNTTFDYKLLVDSYLEALDLNIKENNSEDYSVGGLILSNSVAITSNYWLSESYDEEVSNAHRNADIHIHDLNMLSGDSAGWSLIQLIKEGLGGVEGGVDSAPAKHLNVLCLQLINFLGILQNEWAGAQSLTSFDTYLAPFVKENELEYEEVKDIIQSFVYSLNIPSRWGSLAPFVNIAFDWTVPEDIAKQRVVVGGKELKYTYADCTEEMDIINKAFLEVMLEGDASGNRFQYPIPTYAITTDFNWDDSENNSLLFELATKYGTPFFANYLNSDLKVDDARSINNKKIDYKVVQRKNSSYFGCGENTGSIGSITINLPRLSYQAKNEKDFFKRLDRMMDISARALNTKRRVLSQLLDNGLYPYTKRYIKNFDQHFSTIGLIGMNEACLNANWLGKDLTSQESQDFAVRVLEHMKEKVLSFQQEFKHLFALEATPAEGTSYRLAKKDKEEFEDIITASEETPYYTNSTYLPAGYTDDLFLALDIQDRLQPIYTAGTTFNVYLKEKLSNDNATLILIRKIIGNYHLPYFSITPTYSMCKKHGYLQGEVEVCPKCKKECDVYSRVTGYYRPIRKWNEGKKQEFKDRKTFKVE